MNYDNFLDESGLFMLATAIGVFIVCVDDNS